MGVGALGLSGDTRYLSYGGGDSGPGFIAGAGYDIGIVGPLAVTPYLLFGVSGVHRGATHQHAGLALTFR
jgi:hypothetical protein